MVSYRIRRLPADDESGRRYHLFDRDDQLLLVADQGSAWLPTGDVAQVRFARPGGEQVASMDLPIPAGNRPDSKKQNYAIIYEHAVYALLTAMDLSSGTGSLAQASAPGKFDRLVIEVEGYKWLGLCWTDDDNGRLLVLYDMGTTGLSSSVDPESADLPEPIGLLEVSTGDYDFDLTLPGGRLAQGPLLGLVLVYLVDGLR